MDEFEDWLLWLMETNDTRERNEVFPDGSRTGGFEKLLRDRGVSSSFRAKCPWVLEGFEEGRLFAGSPSLLLDPALIKHRHEIVCKSDEGLMKQMIWQPLPLPLRGAHLMPGETPVAQVHRFISASGKGGAARFVLLAIDKNFNPRPLQFRGLTIAVRNDDKSIKTPDEVTQELRLNTAIMLSVAEDALLPAWWHVYVRDENGRGFKVPATPSSCRKLLQLREGPTTASGRRKALVHWVRAHSRSTFNGPVDVDRHLRGVETVRVDDQFTATIDPRV